MAQGLAGASVVAAGDGSGTWGSVGPVDGGPSAGGEVSAI
ncbi:hypothetical protein DVS28_a2618 [Euzebya pacifica]|uniref:Uncharacterized protein n=1 Tax=Euzebya pacifica TaxID=1608957 RepID=A0A346XYK1_9ACTN|nr:hypothetical protein DVS28_a2618 [Euzebya pacifica]